MCIFASRQCADYAHVSYAGAGEAHMARVTFAVGSGEAQSLFGVCSVQAIMAPPHCYSLHLHCQRTAINCIYLSRAYLNVSDCVMHIWPSLWPWVRAHVCNDLLHDIPERDPPCTYIRMYVLCENRSSIQSLALMRSAARLLSESQKSGASSCNFFACYVFPNLGTLTFVQHY